MSDVISRLEAMAKEIADGHFTVMRFTTNWRVCFGTPMNRCDICDMFVAPTFEEAAEKAIQSNQAVYDVPRSCECACLSGASQDEKVPRQMDWTETTRVHDMPMDACAGIENVDEALNMLSAVAAHCVAAHCNGIDDQDAVLVSNFTWDAMEKIQALRNLKRP